MQDVELSVQIIQPQDTGYSTKAGKLSPLGYIRLQKKKNTLNIKSYCICKPS